MNYEVKKGQQGEKVLFVDGNQSICPYSAPIPFQGNMGQVQILRMPCSNLCPLVEIHDNEWSIRCGNNTKHFALKPESPLYAQN